MIELKPCPFCNGTDQRIDAVDDECEILTVEDYEYLRDNYQESNAANMTYEEWQEDVACNWYLSCQCGACMWGKTKQQAIDRWNRRS